jgi:hypothetical protein
MIGGGAIPGFLWVKAGLTADKSCCMKDIFDYSRDYVYFGVGLAAGLNFTLNLGVGGKWFKTPCIEWADHNGWGRVSAAGGGVIATYGTAFFTTPQTYLQVTSWSWGLDVSILTTIGRWNVQANSFQGK